MAGATVQPGSRHYVVIGGGIVGLAVARRLVRDRPAARVTVLEKEDRWASHQSGHNSGVLHSGLYYAPGSHKALMCRAGAAAMAAYAREVGATVEACGKLVVATDDSEVPRLRALAERGRANGLEVREVGPDEARAIEPHVRCVRALHVPATAIVDFPAVCRAMVAELAQAGADLRPGTEVVGIRRYQRAIAVETRDGVVEADRLVNCAGLHSDRVARMAGFRSEIAIVPFRGEYYDVVPERRHLVKGLIYPVPDPALPFLGVHLTRMVGGAVHAGPSAVLAFSREGYSWGNVNPRDVAQTLRSAGFWRLARRHGRSGAAEIVRSFSRRRFAESVRRLVPEIGEADLVRAPAGVRAQALTRSGALVEDFVIERDDRSVHVLNAPSPAATGSLEIAAHVVSLID